MVVLLPSIPSVYKQTENTAAGSSRQFSVVVRNQREFRKEKTGFLTCLELK